MPAETNKLRVHQAFEAWQAGETAFANWITQSVSQNVIVDVPALTVTGREAYAGYFSAVRAAFPDAQARIIDLIAETETVIVRYTFTGTNTGVLLSRPIVTGKPASLTVVDVYTFVDGKVAHFWQTYDRLAMLEQLDALAAAASVP